MFANWARDTTTTTGTGSLTLSAVTGYPRLSDALPVNLRFGYAILDDTTGAPIECGMGYLSNSTTLVRERVLQTMVSGTFTQVSASAVTLAAGTKRVIAAPLASTVAASLPTIGNGAGARHISNGLAIAPLNVGFYNGLDTVGRMNVIPFYLDFGGVVNGFAITVVTAQASTIVRVGLYAVKADGAAGELLVEGSTAFDTSTTGVKTSSFTARVFPPGWYYLGILSNGTTISLEGTGGTTVQNTFIRAAPWGTEATGSNVAGYALGQATTGMPATCPALTFSTNLTVPHVRLIAAA